MFKITSILDQVQDITLVTLLTVLGAALAMGIAISLMYVFTNRKEIIIIDEYKNKKGYRAKLESKAANIA